jgi:hypothetical protein
MDDVLELLPRAQKQARERIIGGRPVANAEKILSLYDTDVRVLVRGKAGAEVEFGNTLLLGENRQGVILDYQLFQASAPADSQLLLESLSRVEARLGRPVGAVVTDRGFASAANSRALAQTQTLDATCPRTSAELSRKMKDKKFAQLQRRRAQTEARIGILKNGFLGRPLRAKGFAHRELALAWGVLTQPVDAGTPEEDQETGQQAGRPAAPSGVGRRSHSPRILTWEKVSPPTKQNRL